MAAPAVPDLCTCGRSAQACTCVFAAAPRPTVTQSCVDDEILPRVCPPTVSAASPSVRPACVMRGVPVHFAPGRKPFPPQMRVMAGVMAAIGGTARSDSSTSSGGIAPSGTHALIESPTGTGKTLALLCSALSYQRHAWQSAMIEARRAAQAAPSAAGPPPPAPAVPDMPGDPRDHTHTHTRTHAAAAAAAADTDTRDRLNALYELAYEGHSAAKRPAAPAPPGRAPFRVFYCSRTHTQLAQVVRELRRLQGTFFTPSTFTVPAQTSGSDVGNASQCASQPSTETRPLPAATMGVLAARTHLCCNPAVIDSELGVASGARPLFTVDEACRARLTARACGYHKNVDALVRRLPSVWDLDELLQLAETMAVGTATRKVRKSPFASSLADIEDASATAGGCPFFAARTAAMNADLVLCPYNYLLDPIIRDTLQVDVSGSVIIVDEAHNVEDVCRDAASIEITRDVLAEALVSLTAAMRDVETEAAAKLWHEAAGVMLRAIDSRSASPSGPSNITGADCMAFLADAGITAMSLPLFSKSYTDIVAAKERAPTCGVSTRVLKFMEKLVYVVGFMCKRNPAFTDDRTWVNDFMGLWQPPSSPGPRAAAPGALKLSIHCLSPAPAFTAVSSVARSIILTSGTLSPLDSFAASLGTPFAVRIEAEHVIDASKQVLAAVIGEAVSLDSLEAKLVAANVGDRGMPEAGTKAWSLQLGVASALASSGRLLGTHEAAQSDAYIDALGAGALLTCAHTPGGVLMFMPSYRLLERCCTRWQHARLHVRVPLAALDAFREACELGSARVQTAFPDTCVVSVSVYDAITCMKRVFVEGSAAARGKHAPPSVAAEAAAARAASAAATRVFNSAGQLVFVRAAQGNEFAEMLREFRDAVDMATAARADADCGAPSVHRTGALLLAVFRGKASEGIDFSDAHARAVMIAGIPFAQLGDPLVNAQRAYQDTRLREYSVASLTPEAHALGPPLSGAAWYKLSAFRALNQALGRVVRHKDDYGAIIMLDSRFNGATELAHLSKWARPVLRQGGHMAALPVALQAFFATMHTPPPPAAPSRTAVSSQTTTASQPLAAASEPNTQHVDGLSAGDEPETAPPPPPAGVALLTSADLYDDADHATAEADAADTAPAAPELSKADAATEPAVTAGRMSRRRRRKRGLALHVQSPS